MQIWITIEFIGMRVMSIGVLMLPQNGIAQKGHGPNTNIIDKWDVRYCKVPSVMAQCTNQPAEDSKEK
jgi:hypothetical protein